MARLNAKWFNFSERGQAWDHFWQDAAAAGGGTATITDAGDISSAEAIGVPTVTTHAIITDAGGIPSGEAIGAPTVTTIGAPVEPPVVDPGPGIASFSGQGYRAHGYDFKPWTRDDHIWERKPPRPPIKLRPVPKPVPPPYRIAKVEDAGGIPSAEAIGVPTVTTSVIAVPLGRYLVRTRVGELIVSQNMLDVKALREFLTKLRATFAPLKAADFIESESAVFLPLNLGEGKSGVIEIIPEAAIARAKLDVEQETSMEFLQRRRAGMLRAQSIKKMVVEAFTR